ncbi:MAG: hypothetical protein ACKOQM_12200 [Novosphingobium sp.]
MESPGSEPRQGAPLHFWLLSFLGAGGLFSVMIERDFARIENAPQQVQNRTSLIASPNDPQMLQAIKYAQAHARDKAGGGAWDKPKSIGQSVTVETIGGPITLSGDEIAEANEIYPFLVRRAKDPDRHASVSQPDEGFGEGKNDGSEWGN